MKLSIIGAAALLFATAGFAQGRIDFNNIPGIDSQPTVQIDLNEATLGFIIATTRQADPSAAEAMSGIKNVRLRVFEEVDNPRRFLEFIDDTSGALERDGWQRIVFVEDGDSKVRVYMQFEGEAASGITVMVTDGGDESVLINIDGLIDPQALGQIMRNVGAGDFMSGIAGGIPGVTGAALDANEN